MNINTVTTSWGLNKSGPFYNAMLHNIANAAGGRVRVANWASVVLAHPEYLSAGGPHLTDAGATAYRNLMMLGVANCGA